MSGVTEAVQKTDFDVLREMLDRAGIVYQSETGKGAFISISAGEGPSNMGYAGFGTTIEFNEDGSMKTVGAYEG